MICERINNLLNIALFIMNLPDKLVVLGCPTAIYWSIIHEDNNVKLITETNKNKFMKNTLLKIKHILKL